MVSLYQKGYLDRQGLSHGVFYKYHPNGEVYIHGMMCRGKLHGIYRIYDEESCRLVHQCEYFHDRKVGNAISWYPSGQLSFRVDHFTGYTEMWNEDGSMCDDDF